MKKDLDTPACGAYCLAASTLYSKAFGPMPYCRSFWRYQHAVFHGSFTRFSLQALSNGITCVAGGLKSRMPRQIRMSHVVTASLALFATTVQADDRVLPNPGLTPGAVLTTDVSRVCIQGYSRTVRHTSGKLKARIYAEYGIDRHSGHYEIDHLIPLGIGGADTAANLWPQSYDTSPWNAAVKDRLELKLHELVCHRELEIQEAQRAIARDWIDAYKRFCPTDSECPAYRKEGGK